jgi:tetrahydromethanopterin S-methyltransferase subunit B
VLCSERRRWQRSFVFLLVDDCYETSQYLAESIYGFVPGATLWVMVALMVCVRLCVCVCVVCMAK